MVDFTVSLAERAQIEKIVDRVTDLIHRNNGRINREDLVMDLCATHANGCPLDFEWMLGLGGMDLMADVLGIFRNIDRTTGRLMGDWIPMSAVAVRKPRRH